MTENSTQNSLSVLPNRLCGRVCAISSKSYAHRMLIAAALFPKDQVEIEGITLSGDIEATADCLRALGAEIIFGKTTVVIPPKALPKKAVLPCKESGSTLRFFLPIVAALGVETQFLGTERLFARPNAALLDAMQQSGVSMCDNMLTGQLLPGKYTVDATVSSQYVTGLLFALSLVNGDSELALKGECVSSNYIDITLSILKDFGAEIEKTQNGYRIKGNKYHSFSCHNRLAVEGDWSNAAFFIAAAAIGGAVEIENLNPDSLQGDRILCSILKEMGAEIEWKNDLLCVKHNPLQGVSINAQNYPDLVPILSVIAAYSKGKTVIKGVSRLTIKESDRLSGIVAMLRAAKIQCETDGEILTIWGGQPCGGVFSSENDHRMVMSQAILAAYATGNSVLHGINAVQKSYPRFFDDYQSLGGKFYGDVERE